MRSLHGLAALALVLGTLTACAETVSGSAAFRADHERSFYDRPRNRGRDD